VHLSFYINVERLTNVNLVDQTFHCQFDMVLLWRATEDDYRRYKEDRLSYQPSFIPIVKFPNGKIEHQELKKSDGQSYVLFSEGVHDIWGITHQDKNMRCTHLNQCMITVSGEFNEPFELENFPMDVQDLQLSFTVVKNTEYIVFEPVPHNSMTGEVKLMNMNIADYEMFKPFWEFWLETYDRKDGSMQWCYATFRMKIARKWQIYFWRIGIFTMILSMCALAVFTLDHEEYVAERYDILLTLMLSAIAFQYIIHEELPKLPYLTLLDIYVLFSFGFVFFVICCVSIGVVFSINAEADHYFFYLAAALFVLFHIWFVTKSYRARKYEMKKIGFTRWDYEKYGYEENAEVEGKMYGLWNKHIRMNKEFKEKILGECPWWSPQDEWARLN